jgi:hypothetical protein
MHFYKRIFRESQFKLLNHGQLLLYHKLLYILNFYINVLFPKLNKII